MSDPGVAPDRLRLQESTTAASPALGGGRLGAACRTGLVALGNPLRGDDGVGLAVMRAISALPDAPPLVLVDCAPGDLLDILSGSQFERLVVVDAAGLGLPAGDWVRFTPAQARLVIKSSGVAGDEHRMGLPEVLALGETLGLLPPQVWIYAVQPLHVGWEQSLSPAVQAAVPEICSAILSDLAEHRGSLEPAGCTG